MEAMKVTMIFMLASVACACHNLVTADEQFQSIAFFGVTGSLFGHRVNSAGDLNSDGFDDLVVSAPGEGLPGFANASAVYFVFGRSADDWKNTFASEFNFSNFVDTPDSSSWIKACSSTANEALGHNDVTHGDFNGDGISDVIISSNNARAYVVYGHTGAWSSSNIIAFQGFQILTQPSSLVVYVGNAGDLNGDGIDDMLVSESANSLTSPFIIFGQHGATRDHLNTYNVLNSSYGFRIVGGQVAGFMVHGNAGDVNGDGLDDLVLGDHLKNLAYIVFARNVSEKGGYGTSLDVTSLNGNNGVVVAGPTDLYLGRTIVGAGDLNNDGFDDVFIGTNTISAGAWVVFGRESWESTINISQLDGANGFHFAGEQTGWWGFSGGGVGDVNGDDVDDLVIGGYTACNFAGTLQSGAAVVIFGRRRGVAWPAEITRNDIFGSVGFQLDGISNLTEFGHSTRGAGDLNGDGIADIVIGAYLHNNNSGFASLVFGTDDHCAVCSNTSDACLVCRNGFVWDGTICERAPVSSSHESTSTVIMETEGSASIAEVIAEIATLLGVDATTIIVVEVTPGTFEITVSSDSLAHQLVDAIHQCMSHQ